MKLDIFNHIFSMQLIAPTKRAWIYEGSACRLLLLPARHGANRAFGWPDLLRRTTAAGAASADHRCVLRPQDDGKAVQTWSLLPSITSVSCENAAC